MTDLITPRINGSMLNAYVGRKVKIVGKVIKEALTVDDLALIRCSDGVQVEARVLIPDFKINTYVEAVCTVESGYRVSVLGKYSLGDDIDLAKVAKTIVYSHDPRFKHLFEA